MCGTCGMCGNSGLTGEPIELVFPSLIRVVLTDAGDDEVFDLSFVPCGEDTAHSAANGHLAVPFIEIGAGVRQLEVMLCRYVRQGAGVLLYLELVILRELQRDS